MHVVFGSSPAGILRRALSELEIQDKVLDIIDDLSIGPIDDDNPDVRGKWLNNELGEHSWIELLQNDAILPHKSTQGAHRIIAWYAPNRADSYAGFKWWLSKIDRKPISVMSVPDLHFLGTEAMANLVGKEVKLSEEERDHHQTEWRKLKAENALLRIVKNDRLTSASLEYFDEIIHNLVPKEWQTAMRVVGNAHYTISIQTGHVIDDLFILSRLRTLSRSGVIEWDGDIKDRRRSRVRLVHDSIS
nr:MULTISPECIES: DUF3658 domain-containing protein [unclassified Novosphingobium]